MKNIRADLEAFAFQQLGCIGEYPWADKPTFQVLRHPVNGKWAGLTMTIPGCRIGLDVDEIDIINVKLDPLLISGLRTQEGYAPAWHMNKQNWLTVRLDGSVPLEKACALLEMSFAAVSPKPKKKRS